MSFFFSHRLVLDVGGQWWSFHCVVKGWYKGLKRGPWGVGCRKNHTVPEHPSSCDPGVRRYGIFIMCVIPYHYELGKLIY